MFAMQRVAYCMASDGLIFESMAHLVPNKRTPAMASLFTGALAGILTLIFNFDYLINLTSISTLLAYSLVSMSVLILRYMPIEFLDELDNAVVDHQRELNDRASEPIGRAARVVELVFGKSNEPLLGRFLWPESQVPTRATAHLVNALLVFAIVIAIIFGAVLNMPTVNTLEYCIAGVFLTLTFIIAVLIMKQPNVNHMHDTFEVIMISYEKLQAKIKSFK
jgi:amino acid transporter